MYVEEFLAISYVLCNVEEFLAIESIFLMNRIFDGIKKLYWMRSLVFFRSSFNFTKNLVLPIVFDKNISKNLININDCASKQLHDAFAT